MRPKTKHYYCDVYKTNFYFLLGFTPDEIYAWLKRSGEPRPTQDLTTFGGSMLKIAAGYGIWVNHKKRDPRFYSYLAHECLHAATCCFNDKMIEISYANDEALCYLTECLVRKALE